MLEERGVLFGRAETGGTEGLPVSLDWGVHLVSVLGLGHRASPRLARFCSFGISVISGGQPRQRALVGSAAGSGAARGRPQSPGGSVQERASLSLGRTHRLGVGGAGAARKSRRFVQEA